MRYCRRSALLLFFLLGNYGIAQEFTTYDECREKIEKLNFEDKELIQQRDDCANNRYGGAKMNCVGLGVYEKQAKERPSAIRSESIRQELAITRNACTKLSEKKDDRHDGSGKQTTESSAAAYKNVHSGVARIQKGATTNQAPLISKIQKKAMKNIRSSHLNTLKEADRLNDDIEDVEKEKNKNEKKTSADEGTKSF